MLEDQGFCGDGTHATRAEQPREGDEEVDGEDEEFAHEANGTMTAVPRKPVAHTRIPSYYELATHRGLWAIEIKRGLAPKPEKGFHHAREDLKPERSFLVYSGSERYPMAKNVEAIGLNQLAAALAAM